MNENHAPFIFGHHYLIPSVRETGWLPALIELINREGITHVFPAHDDVLLALSECRDQIPAKLVTSPHATCRTTRSKSATYDCLRNAVAVPWYRKHSDATICYPVFVKPDSAQGALDCFRISTPEELHCVLSRRDDFLIMEYLPGKEFTVDCFSHRRLGLLYCAGRERVRTRAGIAMTSVFVLRPELLEFAMRIGENLQFHGAWFFQCKEAGDGTLKLMEVAPRIAGTMCIERARGVNLPLLSLWESEDADVQILAGEYPVHVDRALVARFRIGFKFDIVYVDLDDTLILNGRVNSDLVRFLFQCLNRGHRLILITRHRGCVEETLRKYRLHGIFDETLRVAEDAMKSSVVCSHNAIFIDDSFAERRDVSSRCGIPTFDCSSVPCLFDERIL